MIRVLHVVGARPNFMKIAPLMAEMAADPDTFEQTLIHTGQHYDATMSDVFFGELGMPRPQVNLEVGSGSHAHQTAQVMLRFEPVLREYAPDWVVVPGDVNSTLACALVAAKLGFRIAHLEAGLRSFDRSMPEEINRVLTDRLSDLLLTPSEDADQNLLAEGMDAGKIQFVGNVMIDTLVRLLPQAEGRWLGWQDRLPSGPYLLVTLHRAANVDDAATLAELAHGLRRVAAEIPVVFPVHPRTRRQLNATGLGLRSEHNLLLLEPQGYLDFLALQAHAAAVLTDSGGIQEETTYLGIPCLTARPNTERPVTITHGTNRLVPIRAEALAQGVRAALSARGGSYRPPPLWDGNAAGRVVGALQMASRAEVAHA